MDQFVPMLLDSLWGKLFFSFFALLGVLFFSMLVFSDFWIKKLQLSIDFLDSCIKKLEEYK